MSEGDGGAGGKGLVHDNKTKKDVFMDMAAASAGLTISAAQTDMLIVFKTAAAMNKFVESGWVAGGAATASAGASGATAGSGKGETMVQDADTFTMTKNGIEAGLTVSGANTLAAGGLLIGSGASAVTLAGTGTVAGTLFGSANGEINVFNFSSSVATFTAPFVNNAGGASYLAAAPYGDALGIFGTGTTLLDSTKNIYTGGTNISGTATLKLGQDNAIPGLLQPGNVGISGGATLDLNGKTQILYGLTGVGAVDNPTSTAVSLTIGHNNATTTSVFAGVIQNTGTGAVSLVKTGSGTITLTGQNVYTGGTAVYQGTLSLGFSTATTGGSILPATGLRASSVTITRNCARPNRPSVPPAPASPAAQCTRATPVISGAAGTARG